MTCTCRFIVCLKEALVITFILPSNNWADILFFSESFCSFEQRERTHLSESQSVPFLAFWFYRVTDAGRVWKPSLLPGRWDVVPPAPWLLFSQWPNLHCPRGGGCFSPALVRGWAVLPWEGGVTGLLEILRVNLWNLYWVEFLLSLSSEKPN